MIGFTDGSAQSKPGLNRSGRIIKKQGWKSTPIKIAETVKWMGSSYQGELEAIQITTEHATSPSNDSLDIFSNCSSAILAI